MYSKATTCFRYSGVPKSMCRLLFALSLCLFGSTSLIAEQPEMVVVEGHVVIEDGAHNDSDLMVSVNGQKTNMQGDGRYTIRVPRTDIYQLRFTGPAVFEGIYSFALAELNQVSTDQYEFPPVELVSRKPGRVELIFAGDVMMGRRFEEPLWRPSPLIRPATRASDMAALLEPMAPYLNASDFASVNLETVLSLGDPGENAPKSITFYTHPDIAAVLKDVGIDYVSLGNNHVFDYLDTGLQSTTDTLDRVGLLYSGAGNNEMEAEKASRFEIGEQPYSMLGFVGWAGTVSPNQVAGVSKGGSAHGTEEIIRRSLKSEVADNRITVVQYHGSSEYSDAPTEISKTRLRAAIDAGADLVVGHHPHVTHGLEIYNGKLIAYSMGNFIFDQYFFEAQLAYVLKVWMDGDQFYRAEAIPVQLLDYRPVPAVGQMREGILRRLYSQSSALGTQLSMSGGHAVIAPVNMPFSKEAVSCSVMASGKNMTALLGYDLEQGPQSCVIKDADGWSRGQDIWNRGDFESSRFGEVADQSWDIDNVNMSFSGKARSGLHALQLDAVIANKAIAIAPRTFLRVLDGESYSVTGWIKSDRPVAITAYVQPRPTGVDRLEALDQADRQLIGSKQYQTDSWQQFRFDFAPPKSGKGSHLPMRPMLEFSGTGSILLDDFAIIEQTAPSAPPDTSYELRQNYLISNKYQD